MEIVAPHASVIVPEVLKRNNYKRWSIFLQHYLVGQDLWDVVELSQLPTEGNMGREWIKKNALALHAIKISCGEEMFDQIKEMNSAKDVWDALAAMHKPPDQVIVEPSLERRKGSGNLASSQYEPLVKAISNGKLSEVEKFFKENPNSNAKSARIFEYGYTALHFAVYSGKKEIVDYLIKSNLSQEESEIEDDFGRTTLSVAARCGVGKSIAQSLVRMNHNLLTIPDKDGKIPVEFACSTIQEGMTRYLYRKTPLKYLEGDRGFYILQQCITRKMFDLASRSCYLDSIPLILRLAQTQPPFFRGSTLSFWERWMYDCIRVKAHVTKKDKHRSCVEKMQDFFQTCRDMIQQYFALCAETIQEIRETNPEMIQAIQEFFKKSFTEKCVILLQQLVLFIIAFPVVVLSILVFLIGLAVAIMLSVPLILGKLILVALRILVSVLSGFFKTPLYKIKLTDEYAREVIHLICHESFSKLDEIQFVQSRAVEATFQLAIKNSIPDIVKEITKAKPNILWRSSDLEDSNSRSKIQNIFACAVEHRQEEVANLLYESAMEEKNILFATDKDGNNTLHVAAKLPPQYQLGYIPAAALQLQSELRWFEAVKEIVPPDYNKRKNIDNETPFEVFVREHKDLLKEAEKWVKKTAESSTVVGALIITIMFAVAFTVPGGNDQGTGFPIFLHKTPIPFMIFAVSDAISFFAASNSVIMFLGILTTHHADEDYRKYFLVINGLTFLFISIATMTIAFCAALFIMLQGRLGVVIPITLLAGIPIQWFVRSQFPILVEIFSSTFGLTFRPNIFGKREASWMSGTTAGMVAFGLRVALGLWTFDQGLRRAVKVLAMSTDASDLVT